MGLLDLNFSSLIPGASGFGFNADPIGVGDWLDTPGTADIAAFSSKLDGQDWYKIFPYQFVIVDTSDTQTTTTFEDENPKPVEPTPTDVSALQANVIEASSLENSLDLGAAFDALDAAVASNQAAADNYVKQMNEWQKAKAAADAESDQEEDANAKKIIYTLPIPPDALTVQPLFASEATATITGVVEETSKNVFWMLNLSGTTGMAVGRETTSAAASIFRDRLSTTGLLSGLGAAVGKLASTVTSIAGAVDDLTSADSLVEGAGAVADLANAALLPKLPYFQSAVSDESNGYLEMHLLHRFLVAYGDLKEKHPFGAKLYFINHKDGQQYRVVIKGFRIQKSVNEPHLYRYQITLKGWDLKNPAEAQGEAIDRFKTDLKPVNTTTLTNLVGSLNNLVNNSIGNPNNIIPVVL